jgi:ribosomal protein L40E
MSGVKNKNCKCPFCEGELEEEFVPFCKTCNIPVKRCSKCGAVIPSEANNCPECGQS